MRQTIENFKRNLQKKTKKIKKKGVVFIKYTKKSQKFNKNVNKYLKMHKKIILKEKFKLFMNNYNFFYTFL